MVKILDFRIKFRAHLHIKAFLMYQKCSFFHISRFTIRRLGLIRVERQRKCVKNEVQWKDLKTPHAEGHCVVTLAFKKAICCIWPTQGNWKGRNTFRFIAHSHSADKAKSWNWFKGSVTFRQSYVNGMVRIYNLYIQQIYVK